MVKCLSLLGLFVFGLLFSDFAMSAPLHYSHRLTFSLSTLPRQASIDVLRHSKLEWHKLRSMLQCLSLEYEGTQHFDEDRSFDLLVSVRGEASHVKAAFTFIIAYAADQTSFGSSELLPDIPASKVIRKAGGRFSYDFPEMRENWLTLLGSIHREIDRIASEQAQCEILD